MRRSILFFLLSATFPLNAAEPAAEFFEQEIRPILVEHCQECHSPKKTKGGLRLMSRAELLKGGDSGPAIVPGKPKESLLLQAISYQGGGELRMPPKGKLPDAAIGKLTKWVEQGAVWPDAGAEAVTAKTFQITDEQRKFWAFQPVVSPAIPQVKSPAWCKTDLDRFILAKLEAANLAPAATTDKRTLIRRVTFDLTGLPPTPEEIRQFLDDASPKAFEKVVDRLLASPAYGERWGRHWLDVARYADSRDSRGTGGDTDIIEAWHYRDWVIRAMNKDIPYDQFVRMQIAGDLMPPTEPGGINADGITATGLLAIGEWGTGDADKEKMVTDIVNDQVDVVTRSFLGLTVGCARCHDHKFDPVSQKDYYALAGIFFSSKILPTPGPKTNGSPMLRTPLISPAEQAERTRITNQIKTLEGAIAAKEAASAQEAAAKHLPETAGYLLAAWDYLQATKKRPPLADYAASMKLRADILEKWLEMLTPRGYQLMAKAERDSGGVKNYHTWKNKSDCPNAMINTGNEELSILTFRLPPKSVCVHPGPKSGVAVVWDSPVATTVNIAGKVADRDGTCGDGIAWKVAVNSRTLAEGAINNGQSAPLAGELLKNVIVQPGDRIELQILPKAGYECDSTLVELDISETTGKARWNLTSDVLANDKLNPVPDQQGHPAVWRFMDMADAKQIPPAFVSLPAIGALKNREEVETKIAAFAKTFKAVDTSSPFYPKPGELPATPEVLTLRAELEALKARPMPPVPVVLAIQDGGIPGGMFPAVQDVPIHIRGSYTRLGEKVPRRFPEILAPANQKPLSEVTKESGRKELADFIASPTNPLTARVMVNRVWAWHFGDGLVRTPSNFGKLGERPTHPELLDYLAAGFVADGWSLKKLHKRILLSAVYQQSDVCSEETKTKDADNRLFSRANLRRLEAEAMRDSLLFVAGKLDSTPGGISYPDFNTPRRTVYLRTIRSDKSNFQALFDAADPETPTEKRTISTVAPQALFLMNHPFALAQAKAFADRIQAMPGDDAAKLKAAYERLYGRPPSADEERVTLGFLKTGSWAELSRVLMCANEFAYVR
ncbi:PSD1 and planctomycete cytochrome C domain-containing protein [Zavarzinella formosa]|uniref:PSD1 and planctomycete cytochrome C domain-containing protein n=1 Tax=Zavarzinella formosa TaxID=360055 RepID=UPI0002F23133|nr:PSD1 and planctomycete cytochrome C domain-containing protein [Zavarzinella formosa]